MHRVGLVALAALALSTGCRIVAAYDKAPGGDSSGVDGGDGGRDFSRDTVPDGDGGGGCLPGSSLPVIAALRVTPNSDVAQNAPLYLAWQVSDAEGLAAKPVALQYTTDDARFLSLNHDLLPLAECAVGAPWNGCARVKAPAGGYFRVRLLLEDCQGQVVAHLSAPINSSTFTQLAGQTDDGRDTSARQTVYLPDLSDERVADTGSFVVLDGDVQRADGSKLQAGTVFLRDRLRGLLIVEPPQERVRVLIPLAADLTKPPPASVPVGVAETTLRQPVKIALDFANGLLIFDYDRIRRLDLVTWQLELLVGGGFEQTDGIKRGEVLITPPLPSSEWETRQITLLPLPDGKLYFQSDNYLAPPVSVGSPTAGYRIRLLDVDIVSSLYFSNPAGHRDSLDPAQDPILCSAQSFGVTWDSGTHLVKKRQLTALYAAATPQPSPCNSRSGGGIFDVNDKGEVLDSTGYKHQSNTLFRVVGRNGQLYGIDRQRGQLLHLEPDGGALQWKIIAGAARISPEAAKPCADNQDVSTCALDPVDLFVTKAGTIYFVEAGRVRRLVGQGPPYTVQTTIGRDHAPLWQSDPALVRFSDQLGDVIESTQGYALLDVGRRQILALDGQVKLVAGSGAHTPAQSLSVPASEQGIVTRRWAERAYTFACGGPPGLQRCYYPRGPIAPANTYAISGVGEAGGLWLDTVGTTNTSAKGFYEADGALGSAVLFPAGPMPSVVGMAADRWLLVVAQSEDPNKQERLLLYDLEDGARQLTLAAGTSGARCGTAGAKVPTCAPGLPSNTTHAVYDAPGKRWLIGRMGNKNIDVLPFDAAPAAATVPVAPTSRIDTEVELTGFTFSTTQPGTFWYCTHDGTLREVQSGSSTEHIVPLPGSLRCAGRGMLYEPGGGSRGSLVFLFTHLGSGGLGRLTLD